MRLSKIEILDRFRACCQKLGKTPGKALFCKTAKVTQADFAYYWPRSSDIAKEIGVVPLDMNSRISDSKLFEEYARVCLHLHKIPTMGELRIATRELKTRTHAVRGGRGPIREFDTQFRIWLEKQPDNFRQILDFPGWDRKNFLTKTEKILPSNNVTNHSFYPFLPVCLQNLDMLARGEISKNENSDQSVGVLFERRCAEAFQCLGFEIAPFGQGTGRKADFLALASRERLALIVDAKSRREGYILGTEDRKFLEYAIQHGKELQSKGIDKIYFVVVASSFRESDLEQLRSYLADSQIRSVALITASALIQIVEKSIRERHSFTLSKFDKVLFGNRIITADSKEIFKMLN